MVLCNQVGISRVGFDKAVLTRCVGAGSGMESLGKFRLGQVRNDSVRQSRHCMVGRG